MVLQITIAKSPPGSPLNGTTMIFDQQGATVGRGEANTWVLPDPDRFLSAKHCEFRYVDGQYIITDLSTNGTFVNDAPTALGKGAEQVVCDGDVIDLGDYRFSVTLVVEEQGLATAPSAQSPFADYTSTHFPPADPVAEPPVGEAFRASSGTASGGASDGWVLDESPLSSDPSELDPLAALDRASHAGGAGASPLFQDVAPGGADRAGYLSANHKLGDRDLSDDQSPSKNSGQISDNAGISEAVVWPEAKQENMIPEDWDDDLFHSQADDNGGEILGAGVSAQADTPPKADEGVEANPFVAGIAGLGSSPLLENESNDEGIGVKTQHSRLEQKTPSDAKQQISGCDESFTSSPPIDSPPASPVDTGLPAGDQGVDAPDMRQQAGAASASMSHANAALVDALGFDHMQLSEQEMVDISHQVGSLMHDIVGGMMQVLRSRTTIKNEFRMNVTTIQPVENNPLKFSANVEEALENMFIRKSNAYKKPSEAFEESFNSIAEHQLAIVSGIRSGFKSMMDRFDPKLMESEFEQQGLGAIIPSMHKAKYWRQYQVRYQHFVDNMENAFQHLFGDDFVQGYEDQLHELAAKRERNKK